MGIVIYQYLETTKNYKFKCRSVKIRTAARPRRCKETGYRPVLIIGKKIAER